MERQAFLANIQHNLQSALLPEALPDLPPSPALDGFKAADLVDAFVQEVTALNAVAHRSQNDDDALETILGLFADYKATDYLAWDGEWLPLRELNARLAAQGFTKHNNTLPVYSAERKQVLANLSPVKIGLTGVLGGLADTGSLIVQSGNRRGRLASLLPPVHIALLKTDLLFPTMAHFLQANPDVVQQTSNLVFITGPSRTADIELTLTLGVHGPKELHVILM